MLWLNFKETFKSHKGSRQGICWNCYLKEQFNLLNLQINTYIICDIKLERITTKL